MWHEHIMVELMGKAHLHKEKSNTINSPRSIACCALLTTHLVTSTITRGFSPSLVSVLVSPFGTLVGARACTGIGIDTLYVNMAAAFTITIPIAITVTITAAAGAAGAAAVSIAVNVVTDASSFLRYFLLFIGATNDTAATTTAAYVTAAAAAAAAVRSG
jgi:hypothetical protein